MSHVLHAVVGRTAVVTEFAARWVLARRVPLGQDFALVPLTAALHDDIVELTNVRRPAPYPDFERLSAGIVTALEDVSRAGPVGYFETDCFGGVGTQSAIAWQGGKVLLGPFRTATADGLPHSERAINRLLTALGVWTRGEADPFDMLGLGRFRETES